LKHYTVSQGSAALSFSYGGIYDI